MPAAVKIELVPSDVARVVESVFENMLSLEVVECETAWFPGGDRITAAVHMAGDFQGALLLECDHQQACRFAGHFLSTDPRGAVDDVVRDVLGELVNMIGGNLKCVLTKGVRLTMPSVVDGCDYSVGVDGAQVHARLTFHSREGVLLDHHPDHLVLKSTPKGSRNPSISRSKEH